MSGLYVPAGRVKLRSYSASATPKRLIIKIELETADPDELAYLLRQCAAFAPTAPEPEPRKTKPKTKALGRQELLALPDLRGRD